MIETTSAACAGRAMKHVLHHRRRLGEDADAGGDVDEQDAPEQIELARLHSVIAADADVGDHRALLRRSRPAFGPPAFRRTTEQASAGEHDHEIRGAERHHRSRDADPIHEVDIEIAGEKRAAAKSHDRHAGGHAPSIGKPLHERADWRDVAEAAADAADDAHAEEDEDRLRLQETETADEEAGAEE